MGPLRRDADYVEEMEEEEASSCHLPQQEIDEELQLWKRQILPVVQGHAVELLQESYVPISGEETMSNERDPERNVAQILDRREVPLNRYAGVIHAARFFVTRVGFLRSVKRIMVLSSHHLTIVDPYSEEVKERYAYDNIKEIVIASDGGGTGNNVDRSFTIYIGKSIKETYTCRYRQQLLSAYYQLRERASSYQTDISDFMPLGTGGGFGTSMASTGAMDTDSSNATGSVASTIPVPPAAPTVTATSGATPGMYFDSLFQLCGKSFAMTKLSTTRSTSEKPVMVDILLAVRAASLDRLDADSKAIISSTLLTDIVKIQRVKTNSTELLMYFENSRVHRYWCDAREPFIQSIANNMRSWLNMPLFVEEVADSCEFDGMLATRDIPLPVAFEMPVLKISKNKENPLQLRLLALTSSAILERDPTTRKTLASHSLSDLYNVVMYPSLSSSMSDEETSMNAGLCGKFAFELKRGRTRRFVCLNSMVNRRDKEVGLGLGCALEKHKQQLEQIVSDIGHERSLPPWLRVAGSTNLLNAKECRSLFLSNLIEMCRLNKLHVSMSTEETPIACKEGTWGSEIHPEWEDILLRKLVNLNLIPNLVNKETFDSIHHQLDQFNRNVPIGGVRQRDRRAFTTVMKLLETLKEYCVAQLKSPSSNSDCPIPSTQLQVSLLMTIQRLLCTRGVFEEVPHSQYRGSLEVIMELLHSPSEEVSLAAAWVIKYMVINYSETRSMKSETSNRRALFSKAHCNLFVARAFDLSRHNRIGRDPGVGKTQPMLSPRSREQCESISSGVNGALSSSFAGRDFLVLSLVLQTLEVCLSSGKKATPERVCRELLRAMRVDEFMRHYTLFLFNRSLSFSITKCSSILVKVHVLEQPSELVELIQDFARKHGALLWQLYLALFAQEKAQRRISSQLVALLIHENARSSSVIRRVFPHALLDDLSVKQLEYDEFGRFLLTVNPESSYAKGRVINSPPRRGTTVSGNSDRSPTKTTVLSISTGLARSPPKAPAAGPSAIPRTPGGGPKSSKKDSLSSGLHTRSRLVKHVKCVVLLPEFFDRLWKSYSTKDLIWGQHTLHELTSRLEEEVALLDLYRLQHFCYLLDDPLHSQSANVAAVAAAAALASGTSSSNSNNDQRDSHGQGQSFSALDKMVLDPATLSFELVTSDSLYAASSMLYIPGSTNIFAPFLPPLFLDEGRREYLEDCQDEDDDDDDDDEDADEEGSSHQLGADESRLSHGTGSPDKNSLVNGASSSSLESALASYERDKNRKHRRRNAKVIPPWFVSWNANEFYIDYVCLRDEVRVGAYYLTNILNDRGVLCAEIEDVDSFMQLLYYRLLSEEPVDESMTDANVSNTDWVKSDIRLLVLKVMIQVYEKYCLQLRSLGFLNHLLEVTMMRNKAQWPLVVRGNIALFLDRVLSDSVNVSRFLREEDNVTMLLELLEEVKPVVVNRNGTGIHGLEPERDGEAEVFTEVEDEGDSNGEEEDHDEVDEGEEEEEDGEGEDDQEEYEDEENRPVENQESENLYVRGEDNVQEAGSRDSTHDKDEVGQLDEASSVVTNSSCEAVSLDAVETPEVEPSHRFTVVAEHCGAMSGSMIMQTCLSVLMRLVECHTCDEETHDTSASLVKAHPHGYGNRRNTQAYPKHPRGSAGGAKTGGISDGSAVYPTSNIKQRLCQDETLRFLVGLLDCPNRNVFRKCLNLIRALVRHNETIIPSLHATGLFYFLLRFAQDVDEMTIAAKLINAIHLRQMRRSQLTSRPTLSQKKNVLRPDPLTQICLKSWLVRLLPVSMVAQLVRHGPKRFAESLFADSNNPEVVWNARMRNQMVSFIEKFMASHVDPTTGRFGIRDEDNEDHEACIALIQYPKEVHALQCYQYYLHNLLDEKVFPGWPINDETSFLVALMEGIDRWTHPEMAAEHTSADANLSMTSSANTKQLAVQDVVLLLDSVSLLLRRFPGASSVRSLQHFIWLLEALDKTLSECRRASNHSDTRRRKACIQAFGAAVQVIFLAVKLSDENALECSCGMGLRVLCSSLQYLFMLPSQQPPIDPKDFDVKQVTHWVLEALVGVLKLPNGRVSAAAQSLDLLPCLTYFLARCHDIVATELSLQLVHQMACSSGEMAEVLLLQLAEHGVIWYLTLILFQFNATKTTSASVKQLFAMKPLSTADAGAANGIILEMIANSEDAERLALAAANALARILEATAHEESITSYVKRMQSTIESIFTKPLIECLRKEPSNDPFDQDVDNGLQQPGGPPRMEMGPRGFLQVLVNEARQPHIMWTEEMRCELIELARQAIGFHAQLDVNGQDQEVHQVFELPTSFMYTAQKEELCVAGIYVNFFNENPEASVHAQIAGTVNATKPSASAAAAAAGAAGNSTSASSGLAGMSGDFANSMAAVGKKFLGNKKHAALSSPSKSHGAMVSEEKPSNVVMQGLLMAFSHDVAGVRAQPQVLEAILVSRLLPVATAIRHLIQFTRDMDVQVVQNDGILTLLYVLDHEAQPQAFSFACAPLLQLRCIESLHMLSFSNKCVDSLATLIVPFIKSAFQIVYKHLAKPDSSTEGQLSRTMMQLLGHLCLIPNCIDNLVKGMDPTDLAGLLPQIWLGDPNEMQLLLCLHMIPLKRHTQAATQFAKAAVSSQLANALLNLLSTLVPKTQLGESSQTKSYAARFLAVLSSNPGSGGAISSLLIASRVWETHGETTQGSSEDLKRLLVIPHAPALLKSDHANAQRIGH